MIEDIQNKLNNAKKQLIKKQETFDIVRDEFNSKND